MSENKKCNNKGDDKNQNSCGSSWKDFHEQQLNGAKKAFENFTKNVHGNSFMDKEAALSSHRKNIEALTQANQMALDVVKSIAQLQSQYIKDAFQTMNDSVRNMASSQKSENGMKNHTAKFQEAVHKAVDHTIKIGTMVADSSKAIHTHLHGRVNDGFEEFKQHASKFKH